MWNGKGGNEFDEGEIADSLWCDGNGDLDRYWNTIVEHPRLELVCVSRKLVAAFPARW